MSSDTASERDTNMSSEAASERDTNMSSETASERDEVTIIRDNNTKGRAVAPNVVKSSVNYL